MVEKSGFQLVFVLLELNKRRKNHPTEEMTIDNLQSFGVKVSSLGLKPTNSSYKEKENGLTEVSKENYVKKSTVKKTTK